MTAARSRRLVANPPANEDEEVDDALNADPIESDDVDQADDETPEVVAEEVGIDLTDASALDADNVPADEEHDRVVQAPD